MKKLLIIIFLLTFSQAKSQTPTWEWARSGNGNAEGFGIATDASKNIYLTGGYFDTLSFGNQSLMDTVFGMPEVFLVKYDSAGTVLWAKSSIGIGGGGYGYNLNVDVFGDILLTGWFSGDSISFDSYTLYTTGSPSPFLFLVKYNSSGNVLWAKGAGGGQSQYGYSTSSDANGNIFLTGAFSSSTIIFDSDTLYNSGNADLYITKYDTLGNVIWAKSVGGTSGEWSYGVTADQNGNAYITGWFASSTISFDTIALINSTGSPDFFIAKYNSAGNILWAKSVGGVGFEQGSAIVSTSLNGVYVTGFFNSPSITFDSHTLLNSSTTSGGQNMFLVKYDSSGNVLWAKTTYDTSYCKPFSIAVDQQDNPYIVGNLNISAISFDTITLQLPPNSGDPMFIVRYDSSGIALWAKALASGGDDLNSIAVDYAGDIYVGGDFAINLFVVGSDTLILTGGESPFVAKLSLSIGEGFSEIFNKAIVILFPNPFSDNLNVTVNDNEQSQIILYDILSRKLLQQTFTNSTTINTEQLADGIYIYELRTMNGIIKKGKVIKQ